MMKYIFGIALALGLAFAAYGAAASLSVNGGTIQMGSDDVLACTDTANVLGWGYEVDDGEVHSVRIALDEACAGNAIFAKVMLTGGDPLTLSQEPIVDECDDAPDGQLCVRLDGGDGFLPTSPPVITGIHITIEGPSGSADEPAPGP